VANVAVLQRKQFVLPLSLAFWAMLAVLLGVVFTLTGLSGIFGFAALAGLIVFGAAAAKFPAPVMGMAICCLGLVPFNWGLRSALMPKLFGDEVLLLLYLATFPFLYLFTKRSWQTGFGGLYTVLAVLLGTQAISFVVGSDPVAARNFVETCVLGALLLVLFLQEGSQTDVEVVGKFVSGLTVTIAALSILERIFQWNPLLEHTRDILYLSPGIARITEGVYRPYATFFHPSETGTFMALGVPFVARSWIQHRSLASLLGLTILAGGFFVNGTRGVWVGIAFAAFLQLKNAWLLLSAAFPVAALGGWIGYVAFQHSPFMQRVTDPEDLYSRLEMWNIARKIFIANPWIGVGHMQFGAVYLDFVQDLSNLAQFNISRVYVADNMFVTTVAEHGFLGLASLVGFLVFAGVLLRRVRRALSRSGFDSQAMFVRCCELALIIYVVSGCFADVQQFTKATKLVFILVGLGLATGARYGVSGGGQKADAGKTAWTTGQLQEA
jgi:hypothetical protein